MLQCSVMVICVGSSGGYAVLYNLIFLVILFIFHRKKIHVKHVVKMEIFCAARHVLMPIIPSV